jgi:AcrR family transcriptional regulator
MKIDPRVRRTRQRLHDALLRLAIERGYDAVTVQDVLCQSETARSTFYAHFRDKDDLLISGFRDKGDTLFGSLYPEDGGETPDANFTRPLFEHIYRNKELAKAFFGSSSATLVMGHLRNLIVVQVRKLVTECTRSGDYPVPDELVVQFIAGASFNLLSWWVDHDFPHSVQEMSDACQRLITSGLAPVPLPAPQQAANQLALPIRATGGPN